MEYRAGMFVYAFAFLLGAVIVQQVPALPEIAPYLILFTGALAACLIFCCLLLFRLNNSENCIVHKSHVALITAFTVLIIIGIIYTIFVAGQQLGRRVDAAIIGQDIVITGQVTGLPVTAEGSQRFVFAVESFRILGQGKAVSSISLHNTPQKLRLSWYYGSEVKAGEKWQLEVRLKPPHGFMNPGGFDYEGWLFQQGIHATGYVRQSELNRRLHTASRFSIDRFRQLLRSQIDDSENDKQGGGDVVKSAAMALVKALAVGDKSALSAQQWRTLSNTGTSHLMAISGLHIGLAALFGYMLMRRIVPVSIMKRIPAQHVSLAGGMTLALLYAMVAGLSIPTQRAIIMLLTLSFMTLIRRNSRPVDSLGLAVLVVLLFDPAAVLSAGFWFSFSAVAVIYISVVDGGKATIAIPDSPLPGKLIKTLRKWLKLQLMISLFLLPLSLFMFQQGSLISPLANLLLIPYISFLVVPVILLAIACSFIFHDLSAVMFNLAAALLDFIWPVLTYLSEQPYATWVRGDVDIIELLLASAAMLLLYFSKEIARFAEMRLVKASSWLTNSVICWSLRFSLCLLFLPILTTDIPNLPTGDYQLTVLDVGQGSAAVIRTKNHTAVFDTGARFSDRMDAGSSVLIPYLRSQGIRKLDRLVISHGDMDHIGGAQTLLDHFPVDELVGQDIEGLVLPTDTMASRSPCYDGMQWLWDGVVFEFLSPEIMDVSHAAAEKRNNRSCVLRVSSTSGAALLTGDIEKSVENQLLKKYPDRLRADILIVPHHGSNTSSSQSFINAVDPKLSVISVGYENRYHLPSRQVSSRLNTLNSELIATDKSGAVTIRVQAAEGISVDRFRERVRKYWHHRLH